MSDAADATRCTAAEDDAVALAALLDHLERTGLLLGVLPKAPEARKAGRYLVFRALEHRAPQGPLSCPVLTVADTPLDAARWLETYPNPENTP